MYKRIILLFLLIGYGLSTTLAQHVIVAGRITDDDTHKPIAFATILMKENGYWAITGDDGSFSMKNIPVGKATLTIRCPGLETIQIAFDVIK